jgi:hypothetical protein
MIKFGIIQALRRLPAEFADDARTEVCEARGFLLASRPGVESLCFLLGSRMNRSRTWEKVSNAGRMDGSFEEDRGGFVTSTRERRARAGA